MGSKSIDSPTFGKDYLRNIYNEENEILLKKYNRSLSFADALFDRWERAESLGFGEGSSIYNSATVFGDVKVGKAVWVGPNVMLDGSGGGLSIGDECNISAGVQIYTHDTVKRTLTARKLETATSPVRIGSCTYIGANATICKGVSIGDQCVIGAGAVIVKNAPNKTIWAGVPARQIGQVFIENGEVKLEYN